jgi:hypothetical protein
LNGKANITPEIAIRLGKALGTSPESWLNQQLEILRLNLYLLPNFLGDHYREKSRGNLRSLTFSHLRPLP